MQEFTSQGVFLLMFGEQVNKTAVALHGSTAEQDVCTELSGDECQAGISSSAPGGFETPEFVTVDNDAASTSFHDVYVADTGDNIVSKFTPAGVLVESWGIKGQLNGSTTTAKSFGSIAGIAVNTTGELDVLNTADHVFEFEAKSKFVQEIKFVTGLTEVAPAGLAVNGKGDLFKVIPAGYVIEFEATGTELGFVDINSPAHMLTGEPKGDLYWAGVAETLDHDELNGAGEVLQPGGSSCPITPATECGASDSVPVGFVGAGIGVVSSSGDTVLSNGSEGKEWEFSPLVIVPDVTTGRGVPRAGGQSVEVNGDVDPEGVALKTCEFEYVEAAKLDESAANPYAAGASVACEDPDVAEIGAVTGEVPVHAQIVGLSPGVTYDFRLAASNKNDEAIGPVPGSKGAVETLPPPSIDSATVSGLSASGAVLNASIDPHEATSSYYFEYDTKPYTLTEGAHGTRVPAREGEDPVIKAGGADVAVSTAIVGLSADVTYYWRVVAENASGVRTGVGHSFVYETASSGLPDGRAYEMVTPVQKNGSLLGDVSFTGLPPVVAADGQHVMSTAIQCFDGAESCNAQQANNVGSPYEFTRTSAGWVTTPLSPPASIFTQSALWEYNPQESTALFSMPTGPAGEDDFYAREPATGSYVDIGPDTPPEDGALGPKGGIANAADDAATADDSHVVWDAFYRWTSPLEGGVELFEYAGVRNPRPLQVGVSGGEGSSDLVSNCGTLLGGAAPLRPMSGDGRTVFFEAQPCSEGAFGEVPVVELFARADGESTSAHTVAVSEPSPSACGSGGGAGEVSCRAAEATPANAGFVAGSEDGSDALFLSPQQLTDGASEDSDSSDDAAKLGGCGGTVGANGCNLYLFEGVTAEHAGERRLVDVSEGEGVVAGGPRVQGVLAVSPESKGESVYFVAKGVLTGRERAGCMAEWAAVGRGSEAVCHAVEGADNLYVYDAEAHSLSFITVMTGSDGAEWTEEADQPANVTPGGEFMVFVSHGALTADDTTRSPADQVFRYDAATGGLLRMSIGNSGFNDDGNRSSTTPCEAANSHRCSEDAGIVPGDGSVRSDPSMSDDGLRVFFESPVALTAHALDDVQIGLGNEIYGGENIPVYARNVYEWEAEGVGSCPAGRAQGCVFLISDGRDVAVNRGVSDLCAHGSAVCLLGADTTGDNVFFATTDQLVASDTNTELDFYDARVCEPEAGNPCVEAPGVLAGCTGEECHGAPTVAPGVPSPGSLTFSGPGNPTPPVVKPPLPPTLHERLEKALRSCRVKHQHSKRKRAACERVAQHSFGAKPKAGKFSRVSGRSSRRGGR